MCMLRLHKSLDQEMQQRIKHHQQQRPDDWQLCEEPIFLADQLLQLDQDNQVILVDCLTLWLTNLLLSDNAELQQQQTDKFLKPITPTQITHYFSE